MADRFLVSQDAKGTWDLPGFPGHSRTDRLSAQRNKKQNPAMIGGIRCFTWGLPPLAVVARQAALQLIGAFPERMGG